MAVALALGAPSAQAAVSVWDTSGPKPRPCTAIDASDPERVRGGCVLDVGTRGIEVVIRSVVGDMVFGTCRYGFDLRIDATGRTYLGGIASGGPNPCNDIGACDHENVKPWNGQIEAGSGGRLTHVVDACLDTCMGQFVGELRLDLRRTPGGGWEQVADRALVGDTGYQLDGRWNVIGGRGIDIRTDASAGADAAGIWRLAREPVGWPLELG